MISETIKLSDKAKRQLILLKRRTGIEQWNILCRWAFCVSLNDNSPIVSENHSISSNVEMTWKTFAGTREAMYESLLNLSYNRNLDPHLSKINFLRAHLHRGISQLVATNKISSIVDLLLLQRQLAERK